MGDIHQTKNDSESNGLFHAIIREITCSFYFWPGASERASERYAQFSESRKIA
jgi:hypothetical protein